MRRGRHDLTGDGGGSGRDGSGDGNYASADVCRNVDFISLRALCVMVCVYVRACVCVCVCVCVN